MATRKTTFKGPDPEKIKAEAAQRMGVKKPEVQPVPCPTCGKIAEEHVPPVRGTNDAGEPIVTRSFTCPDGHSFGREQRLK